MRCILFVFLLFGCWPWPGSSAVAQAPTQRVQGVVLDDAAQTPVEYANVKISREGFAAGAQTDSAGVFVIENVPVGRYTVEVTFVGYEPTVVPEVQVGSGRATVLRLVLRESYTAQEVVITADPNKDQALNSMAIVSARQFNVDEARRYAGGFDDPARLASSFAGVASTGTANNGIVIRGNAPSGLLWRMEGVEIPNPNHFADATAFGAGGLTALSSQMLANSDFYTGAFPAEFGNATSGVFDLNLRTGNASERNHTAQIGLVGIDFASEGPFRRGKPATYLFNYRLSSFTLLQPLLPDEADGTWYSDLCFKINIPLVRNGVITVWGLGSVDASGAEAIQDSTEWTYDQHRERQRNQQFMGVLGTSYRHYFGNHTFWSTTLATTAQGLEVSTDRLDTGMTLRPLNAISSQQGNVFLNTYLNHKFGPRHTLRVGVNSRLLGYSLHLQNASDPSLPMQDAANETGATVLLQAYASSSLRLGERLTATLGFHSQHFTLSGETTAEPRAGLKWQLHPRHGLALGYGLHSRLERLGVYLMEVPNANRTATQPNRHLRMSKAHHLVMGYNVKMSSNLRLMLEPYVQQQFHIPTEPDGWFSLSNSTHQWFLISEFESTGIGQTMGLDITLERFLHRGVFFLVTASVFDARYRAGDGVWRHSLYNRNYIANVLIGKEFSIGREHQHVVGFSIRGVAQGGERFTPVDLAATSAIGQIVLDNYRHLGEQRPAAFIAHATANLRFNRRRYASVWSLSILNATAVPDFYGYRINRQTGAIEAHEETIIIPNLSYKIEF